MFVLARRSVVAKRCGRFDLPSLLGILTQAMKFQTHSIVLKCTSAVGEWPIQWFLAGHCSVVTVDVRCALNHVVPCEGRRNRYSRDVRPAGRSQNRRSKRSGDTSLARRCCRTQSGGHTATMDNRMKPAAAASIAASES